MNKPAWELQVHHRLEPVAYPPVEWGFLMKDKNNYRYHYNRWASMRWTVLIEEVLGTLVRIARNELTPGEMPFAEYRCEYDILKNQYVMKVELI